MVLNPTTLFPELAGFTITAVTGCSDVIGLAITPTPMAARCPACDTSSTHVHSRYRRTLAAPALGTRPLILRVTARKFRCDHLLCRRQIFCERLTTLSQPHARTTTALSDLQRVVALALGGQAGSRLTQAMNIPTSGSTLLRRIATTANEPEPTYRFIGIDDFALRKGQVYGTILIDLERGRVIDLLDGRDGAALEAWLKNHPGVEVITRDRWAAYANAATAGAPNARQVADRFHLVKNARELVERIFESQERELDEGFQPRPTETPVPECLENPAEMPPTPTGTPASEPAPGAVPESASPKASRREARFTEVRRRRAEGQGIRQIAREFHMSRQTVVKYLRRESCPDWNAGRARPSRLDPFREAVDVYIRVGGRLATELFEKLKADGCRSSYDAVRRFFAKRLFAAGVTRERANSRAPPRPNRPTARQLSFAYVRRAGNRTEEEASHVRVMAGVCQELKWVDAFLELVRGTATVSLSDWLTQAEHSSSRFIRSFAESIRSDEVAVLAAVTTSWSNGPVEGHVNRVKAIKRSMYGRAKLPLLRCRVCTK